VADAIDRTDTQATSKDGQTKALEQLLATDSKARLVGAIFRSSALSELSVHATARLHVSMAM